jgi:tetratricopeptide (TPR) repeat protein
MRSTRWFMLGALTVGRVAAQGIIPNEHITPKCEELNQVVIAEVARGQVEAAERSLSAAPDGLVTSSEYTCAGLILTNMAALMSLSGRFAEAQRFAEQSISILEKSYPPDDLVLLRPLQILAGAQFEQGRTGRAREALNRMRSIRVERPEDRALVHGMAATQLCAEGKRTEAEPEYLAALRALEEAGRGNNADAGAVLTGLASLYIEELRFDAARRALGRALGIFTTAKDSVPMDRIKLLNVRAVLLVRKGEWLEAERDLSDALSMVERESREDSVIFRSLLTNYAGVLRKNHHRREARTIERRASVLRANRAEDVVVDVTDFLAKPKSTKR